MTTFYFIRHGETEWNNNQNRYCGRSDIALAETGVFQSRILAKMLGTIPFDKAFSSPLLRARKTALPITERLGLPLHLDDRLKEIDFGDWEGLTQQEIELNYPQQWQSWIEDPTFIKAGGNGESGIDAAQRMRSFVDDMVTSPFETILVISHNTVMRLFIAASLGLSLVSYRNFEIDNGDIWVVNIDDSGLIKWKSGLHMAHLMMQGIEPLI
ncbi:histidine phosphatase family protein [Sulfobacillus thermosulfidooxidans]|uniref:histidine phosphatase family protein n=1 Tax=Sulfobacillus thermosulfidooxidans TaxID=28034 RepID=UPI00096B68B4|nr:histidine phosphatase family protein [Sulfobacillus thermosulfidooxidans]OLZ09276.1 phosphoglycerate kinase [Sulfobacillus thermosulfidooxidans]OLZ13503.1 phosphoglycerate kinase [Sulfobacillus thermosulfidooxidans]OLZ21843.1 phosphoglycerate kinase [Sulfobacillus thermosulfidooxidans]